jgi:DNA helicase HerA-like ATPase
MPNKEAFVQLVKENYTFKGEAFRIGTVVLDGEVLTGTDVCIPLKTMNRHGLIAGATGTGKTKSLQLIAEALSDAGVPVLLMDIKGDLSGIAAAGAENNNIKERLSKIGGEYKPEAFPVELMTLSNEKGVRLRATVSEFGPILLSKILDLNNTQEGIVSLIFKYCDDNKMPLLDLKDFIKVIQFISNEGKKEIEQSY